MASQRWKYINDPCHLWANMPLLVVAELSIYAAALLTLWHAWSKRSASSSAPSSLNVWLSALLAGIMTDSLFALLPIADNFWHVQALVMVNNRVPLYVPCLYVLMLYIPLSIMNDVHSHVSVRVAFGGLAAATMLNSYDNLSSTFLFTTWHDTDPLIAARVIGNPVGNLLFCLFYGGSYNLWFALLPKRLLLLRALISGLLAIPSVIIFSTLFQLASGNFSGAPRHTDLAVVVFFFVAMLAVALTRFSHFSRARRSYRLLYLAQTLYQGIFLAIAICGDPQRQISTGYHQEIGPCNETITDELTGLTKSRYLCANNYTERFRLNCSSEPASSHTSTWYTICGSPNIDYIPHVMSTLASLLLTSGGLLFMARVSFIQNNKKQR